MTATEADGDATPTPGVAILTAAAEVVRTDRPLWGGPQLAEPLAAWLDRAAADARRGEDVTEAVVVARIITGSAS